MPDHLSENATALLKRMICVEAEKRPTTKEVKLVKLIISV